MQRRFTITMEDCQSVRAPNRWCTADVVVDVDHEVHDNGLHEHTVQVIKAEGVLMDADDIVNKRLTTDQVFDHIGAAAIDDAAIGEFHET